MATRIVPDLQALVEVNRRHPHVRVTWVPESEGRPALHLSPLKREFAVEDEWVIPFPDITFGDGVIEFDARGQSEPPQSNFLGIAFRYVDETTHDAVYLRPFNFRAEDSDRRSHAVQYISHPEHSWFKLREHSPLQFEQPVNPAPDGDAWFHVRIEVEQRQVRVYVDGAAEPSLEVRELSDRVSGGLGLWVGPGQGGFFANVAIGQHP